MSQSHYVWFLPTADIVEPLDCFQYQYFSGLIRLYCSLGALNPDTSYQKRWIWILYMSHGVYWVRWITKPELTYCYLTSSIHYSNQCWLFKEIPEITFTSTAAEYHEYAFENVFWNISAILFQYVNEQHLINRSICLSVNNFAGLWYDIMALQDDAIYATIVFTRHLTQWKACLTFETLLNSTNCKLVSTGSTPMCRFLYHKLQRFGPCEHHYVLRTKSNERDNNMKCTEFLWYNVLQK